MTNEQAEQRIRELAVKLYDLNALIEDKETMVATDVDMSRKKAADLAVLHWKSSGVLREINEIMNQSKHDPTS